MGKKYSSLSAQHSDFIAQQRLFFVATAVADGRVNVSPKGLDSLRVIDPQRIVWLNYTGSGNETAGHVQENPRMTLMFASFTIQPLILRVYGTAKVYHPRDAQWDELAPQFPPQTGARQIFDVAIELVQNSCGFAVPRYDYIGGRQTLEKWADKKGEQGIEEFWQQRNTVTLDGAPTHIEQKALSHKQS